MLDTMTPGAARAVAQSQRRAAHRGADRVEAVDLLAALGDEEESRAVESLRDHGLSSASLLRAVGVEPMGDEAVASGDELPQSPEVQDVISAAGRLARSVDRRRPIGTEHLLLPLLDLPAFGRKLADAGLKIRELRDELTRSQEADLTPIAMDADISPLELSSPSDAVDLGRVLDASANRAREGLRVVEDYVRFALDDPMLTRRLKDVRHRLDEAVRGLDPDLLLDSRDTRGDVGTHIMTASERSRENPRAVLAANFKRAGEALRSLEEYSKLVDVWISGRFEVLRYDVYTLEKLAITALTAHRTWDDVKLYVLVGGLPTLGDLTWIVGEALAGGAQAIQLREKGIDDRELLRRAREVRILTAQARAKFVLNDRPDLARLAAADAVHLGQDDLTTRDARRIVGPRTSLGVSTHEIGQVEKAVLDGAGYLGVGPVFTSETKAFASFAGLEFVRQASETTRLPWFAIGGIHEENIDQVLGAGATRIAVSGAVVRAVAPRSAARALRRKLDSLA